MQDYSDWIPRFNVSLQFNSTLTACILAVVIVVLSAFSCGGEIPPTHYYKLNIPPAPLAAQAEGIKTAILMPFRGSKMLTQDKIVYRPNLEEVGFYEYHRWAEDPRTTIAQSLLDHLRSKKTFHRIVMFDGRTTADYLIRGRIERLEEVDSPDGSTVSVALRVSADLLSVANREPLWSGVHEETAGVQIRDVRTVVSRMSAAAAASVAKIAADIDGFVRSHQNVAGPSRSASTRYAN